MRMEKCPLCKKTAVYCLCSGIFKKDGTLTDNAKKIKQDKRKSS